MWKPESRLCGLSATARSCATPGFMDQGTHTKLPGFRSRRCRRRTWRSCRAEAGEVEMALSDALTDLAEKAREAEANAKTRARRPRPSSQQKLAAAKEAADKQAAELCTN
jgi:hypothetical protein